MKTLLEARFGEQWRPIRIAHEFPSVRAALDSLSMFARQQRVCVDDVRMKVLRTEDTLLAAENAIIAYHHEQADDPQR